MNITWEENEFHALEFAAKAKAVYVMRCTDSQAMNGSMKHRIKIKSTESIKVVDYSLNESTLHSIKPESTNDHARVDFFFSTFPHNRYVLFTPQAFVDLKEAVLRRIEAHGKTALGSSALLATTLEAERELRVRLNILRAEVEKMRKHWFLRFIARIFGVNLDIIQDWKQAQMRAAFTDESIRGGGYG